MNTILIQGDWNILKGKLKQIWALIIGDLLDYQEGRAEVCLGRIQKKAGAKRAAIKRAKRECEKLWLQIDPCSEWLSSR
ncbi:MAG: CsbD family protein [Prosthecobacter sp.]|uniref:CsbD family protein n=1 Tax=Prosthecobacter sp. TaxID=1965333 RepID=UPI0025F7CE68|nr:CsbD family protein [Prosthecobacter sp.]MCF7785659.1 CsbD family protein [Prosthecobacter sp.]